LFWQKLAITGILAGWLAAACWLLEKWGPGPKKRGKTTRAGGSGRGRK